MSNASGSALQESPLKVLRYEDTSPSGPPPVLGQATSSAAPLPTKKPRSITPSFASGSPKRPRTSPNPRPDRVSRLFGDSKRDSGIAPSIDTAGRTSYAESFLSGHTGGAARSPALPTIVVGHDDESPAERSRSPFAIRRSRDSARNQAAPQPFPPHQQRLQSFKAIDTEIPTDGLGDLNLGDLATDKIGFSHRGSMLFGGMKMNELIAARADDPPRIDGMVSPMPLVQEPEESLRRPEPVEGFPSKGLATNPKIQRDASIPAETAARAQEQVQRQPEEQIPVTTQEQRPGQAQEPEKPKALVSGRRKPSVHMLQAALQGGRVLSAEEITFSLRVRSMYDHGDENAADWNSGFASLASPPQETPGRDSTTPDMAADGIQVPRIRRRGDSTRTSNAANSIRLNYYAKEPSERAGGIEDWEDVASPDVDRYGFIHTRRHVSRGSVASNSPGEPLQRVASSLRAQAEKGRGPRTLRRRPSMARSARSMPQRDSGDWSVRKGPGSIHSAHSSSRASTSSRFRSRDRRVLADASDMLTLPPGLAAIAENDDAGRTASLLKQREWAREQKWQKMAIPVSATHGSGKGGGMRFEFDTTNTKVIERAWKGIPDRWRATAWHSFLSASARRRRRDSPASDEELITQYHKLQTAGCADDVQIDVDVPRTVNLHVMFRRRYRGGQRLLFRVLHAVALYFPGTGYVQGMASLAATLLCYFDEERAFVMLVRLWQLRGLEQLFQDGFQGLMTALRDFETHWLAAGDVARKLDELGITATAYGTRWYLTLFNMSVPFPAQLRVWDVFMLLGDDDGSSVRPAPALPASSPTAAPTAAPGGGDDRGAFGGADLDVLHATSAALIDATREIILDSDFENAMKVLTSFVPIRDEDLLMRVARTEWKLGKKRAGERV